MNLTLGIPDMKITTIKDQEDCFDGTIMKEVQFDEPLEKAFIDYLGTKGTLEYYPSFARPFFKVEVKGHYYVKGIEKNRHLSLVLYKKDPSQSLEMFIDHIKQYIVSIE